MKVSYVDGTERASTDPKSSGRSSPTGDYMQVGETEVPSRAHVSAFGFKAPISRSPRACFPAASATGSTLRSR
ncbi:MAG: hypothetical protein ACLT98_15305 [Eggerthellaceae bacterium]